MNISITRFSKVPLYEQIMNELKRNIMTGQLAEREQLPSIRKLAKDLEVSVITVKKAYETLEQEGFLVTIPSQGTYVADLDIPALNDQVLLQIDQSLEEVAQKAQAINLPLEDLQQMLAEKMEEKDD